MYLKVNNKMYYMIITPQKDIEKKCKTACESICNLKFPNNNLLLNRYDSYPHPHTSNIEFARTLAFFQCYNQCVENSKENKM